MRGRANVSKRNKAVPGGTALLVEENQGVESWNPTLPGRLKLVAGDGLGFFAVAIDWRCGVVGGRLDGVEAYEAFDRLLTEYVFAIELCHFGVLGVGLDLGIAGTNAFFASVLGNTEFVEGVVGF